MAEVIIINKQPGENIEYAFDFTATLPTGVLLQVAGSTIVVLDEAEVDVTSTLISGTLALDVPKQKSSIKIQNGTDKANYPGKLTMALDDGFNDISQDFVVKVRDI